MRLARSASSAVAPDAPHAPAEPIVDLVAVVPDAPPWAARVQEALRTECARLGREIEGVVASLLARIAWIERENDALRAQAGAALHLAARAAELEAELERLRREALPPLDDEELPDFLRDGSTEV